jgi:TetR/AcrR family transcriptional regulator, lmrAB and yxaGH operons repressor
MSTARDLIIETACDLLESQGFHATGLNQIVKESGAPKGSLYHYFPDGKDAIAEAAIARAGRTVAERIAAGLGRSDNPAEAVRDFVMLVADRVEASGYRRGGPLTTVAMETATTNERLNRACREAYGLLEGAFAAKLMRAAFPEAQARQLATFIVASIEGGILLCRTYHGGDPLRLVAEQLGRMIEAAMLAEGSVPGREHNQGST